MKVLPVLLGSVLYISSIYTVGNMLQIGSSALRSEMDSSVFDGISKPVNDTDIEGIFEMYRANPSSSFIQERMNREVVFEDPLSIVVGGAGVHEAFRGLKYLDAEMADYAVNSEGIYILMNYTISGSQTQVMSRLYVNYDSDHKITHIQEQWNDVPLFHNPLSRLIRRINALILDSITKHMD